jgi:hypothetical protein
MFKAKTLITLISLTLVLQINPVFAERGPSGNSQSSRIETKTEVENEINENNGSRLEEIRKKIASRSQLKKEKLEEVKAKICQKKQEILKKRSQSLANRAENQFKIFTKIEARVEDFYLNRMFTRGLVVSNFDQLKADITNKKNEVVDLLAVTKQDAANFSCTGDDPKGQLRNFRADMKAVIKALKEYRTSIKNLIVAIRTTFNNGKEATGSEKPATSSAVERE